MDKILVNKMDKVFGIIGEKIPNTKYKVGDIVLIDNNTAINDVGIIVKYGDMFCIYGRCTDDFRVTKNYKVVSKIMDCEVLNKDILSELNIKGLSIREGFDINIIKFLNELNDLSKKYEMRIPELSEKFELTNDYYDGIAKCIYNEDKKDYEILCYL